jgi:hypothetical protein
LGTSASDVLFSAGSIFVEGPHDIETLESGFSEIVVRYNITQLGGRNAVEKEIKTLQLAETNGEVDTIKCFIFDLDQAPTSLHSTRLVMVGILAQYGGEKSIGAVALSDNDAHSGVYQSFLDRFRARGELANRYVERPINYVFGWPFAGGIPLRKTQALTSQNIREMIIINDDFQTFV